MTECTLSIFQLRVVNGRTDSGRVIKGKRLEPVPGLVYQAAIVTNLVEVVEANLYFIDARLLLLDDLPL